MKRHTSSSTLNAHSSRSHSICQSELITPAASKTFWLDAKRASGCDTCLPKNGFSHHRHKAQGPTKQETAKSFRMKLDPLQKQVVNKNNLEKQIQLLKAQLSISQAETGVLKNENLNLKEELQDVESQVRMEAAEEMQLQLQAMRAEYDAMYAKLERKTQLTPSRSMKEAQL
jgi:hypothetical protein